MQREDERGLSEGDEDPEGEDPVRRGLECLVNMYSVIDVSPLDDYPSYASRNRDALTRDHTYTYMRARARVTGEGWETLDGNYLPIWWQGCLLWLQGTWYEANDTELYVFVWLCCYPPSAGLFSFRSENRILGFDFEKHYELSKHFHEINLSWAS